MAGNKIFAFFIGMCNKFCSVDFRILALGHAWAGHTSKPPENSLELEGCAGRQRHRKLKLGELVSGRKILKKQTCVILQLRDRHKQVNWILGSSFLSLYLSIVFVCLYSWCCNHGFFSRGFHVVCIVLIWKNYIYIFEFFSCFLFFFLFLWQYLCMWLSHYAPKRLQSCNSLLDCGGDWELIYYAY